MSYDISLVDSDGKVLQIEGGHDICGGTYCLGGTTDAWLNVTYNYSKYFYRTMGEKGIRAIYGMTGEESIQILEKAISELGTDPAPSYWEPTEGNARKALEGLLQLAKLALHGIWEGD